MKWLDWLILNNSDAIRTLYGYMILLTVFLIAVVIFIVYITKRQKANKPLPSSNRKSRFASAYNSRSAAVSNEPVRRASAAESASNAIRRQNAPEPGAAQPAYSSGVVRQRAEVIPRLQAEPVIATDAEAGVLAFCFEYMEEYRI